VLCLADFAIISHQHFPSRATAAATEENMSKPISALQFERFITNLERQISRLREISGVVTQPTHYSTPPPAKRVELKRARKPIQLAPGHLLRTQAHSLYTVVLRAQANACNLSKQPELFSRFTARPTEAAAKKLLQRITVRTDDLLVIVKADPEYQQHCDRMTERYFTKAAAGDTKAQRVLDNPKIVQNSKWQGDFDEVFTVLYTGRNPANLKRCKNVQILRRANVAWDRLYIGSTEYVTVYPVRYYSQFQRVKALATSLTSL
jgi:hypothetical protein